MHVATQLAQPAKQDRFGDVLRNHERVGVAGAKLIEVDRRQHLVTISKGEPGALRGLGAQSIGDLQLLQHLEVRACTTAAREVLAPSAS